LASEQASTTNARRGVTLVELVIAMGVVGVTVGATAAMLYAGGRSLPGANDGVDEAIRMQDALRTITDLARPASNIEILEASRVRFTARDTETGENRTIVIRRRGDANNQIDYRVANGDWRTIIQPIRGFIIEPIVAGANTVGLRFTILLPSGVELSGATDLPNIIGALP